MWECPFLQPGLMEVLTVVKNFVAGMVAYTYNSRTPEIKAGLSWYIVTVSFKKFDEKKNNC